MCSDNRAKWTFVVFEPLWMIFSLILGIYSSYLYWRIRLTQNYHISNLQGGKKIGFTFRNLNLQQRSQNTWNFAFDLFRVLSRFSLWKKWILYPKKHRNSGLDHHFLISTSKVLLKTNIWYLAYGAKSRQWPFSCLKGTEYILNLFPRIIFLH